MTVGCGSRRLGDRMNWRRGPDGAVAGVAAAAAAGVGRRGC